MEAFRQAIFILGGVLLPPALVSLQEETLEHCFRYCPKASQVLKNLKQHELLFAAALWWIWRDRNNDVFNSNSPWTLEKINIGFIRHALCEFEKVSSSSLSLTPLQLIYAWTPPLALAHKVNCDASLLHHDMVAGFGCVLRDSIGNWIKGCSSELVSSVLNFSQASSSIDADIKDLLAKIQEVLLGCLRSSYSKNNEQEDLPSS
ncbi:hypothetical protein PIB30_033110 [Stylosanthes scabra]|uniref:Uncharacterized protein n=1 Tax=Stylosanthes scabra TaxID=79078 RepID=A0ABU6TD52_9FABA|nr:hypothetical protein [Stylosanthes scabra]